MMKIHKKIRKFLEKNHHIICVKYTIQSVKKHKDLMKIRKNPEKSGKIRKNLEKSRKLWKNPENPDFLTQFQKDSVIMVTKGI